MKKGSLDDSVFYSPPATGLPLFGQIKLDAPVAPGSDSSQAAAALVSVDGECLRVLTWIAKQSVAPTRYDVAIGVYPVNERRKVAGLGPACGRVNMLVTLGYLVEVGRRDRKATLAVTESGRHWLSKREAVWSKKRKAPPINIDDAGKIIDLILALKQALAGQPVTGIPEKAAVPVPSAVSDEEER